MLGRLDLEMAQRIFSFLGSLHIVILALGTIASIIPQILLHFRYPLIVDAAKYVTVILI